MRLGQSYYIKTLLIIDIKNKQYSTYILSYINIRIIHSSAR